MSTNPSHPKPPTVSEDRDPNSERRSRLLAELAELGMEVARAMQKRALLAADPATMEKLALEFASVVDSVCQTVALQAELAGAAESRQQQSASPGPQPAVAVRDLRAEQVRRERSRKRVKQSVEQAINANGDSKRAETLLLDLDERLEDEDIAAILGRHADVDVVLKLCRELGVAPDLKLRRNPV